MNLKIFHLNIQCGRKLDEVISYINEHNFDIIHFQEVAGGSISKTGSDVFQTLQEKLPYIGELTVSGRLQKESAAYYGNATFYRPEFKIVDSKVVWMKSYKEYDTWVNGGDFARELARNALCLKFEFEHTSLWSINTHMAWGPTPYDEPYKINMASKLLEYLKKLNDPFILTGDFNVTKDSEIVRSFAKLGVNHAVLAGLTNTLNPRLHRVPQLFPPGLAVDFAFTSFGLEAYDFQLVDSPDLSDHFGLRMTISLNN